MPSIFAGYRFSKFGSPSRLDSLPDDVRDRFAEYFSGPFTHSGLSHDGLTGLLCFGPCLDEDRNLLQSPNLHVCLKGLASITAEPDVRLLTPTSLLEIVRNSNSSNLSKINPPFSLAWYDQDANELGVAVDGAGMQQVFVWQEGNDLVFSNNLWLLLRLSGIRPTPDLDAWTHWFARGWFPDNRTGFLNISILRPGQRIIANSEIISRTTDCYTEWLSARHSLTDDELLHRATSSFCGVVSANIADHARVEADLTGGVDSRAVCAAILRQGVQCSFYTNGVPLDDDAIIARKLASELGLDWHLNRPLAGMASDKPDWHSIETAFRRMITWEGGNVEPNRFEHFLSIPSVGSRQPNPTTYFYGGQSELSRAFFYGQVMRQSPRTLAATVCSNLPESIRSAALQVMEPPRAALVADLVRCSLNVGFEHGLRGFDLLDFHYLYDRVRRWGAAHRACSLGDCKVSPFFNVDHFQLIFALTSWAKANSAFQYHLIETCHPRLSGLPYSRHLARSKVWRFLPLIRKFSGRRNAASTADSFRILAAPFLRSIIAGDSPLFEILDRSRVKAAVEAFLQGDGRHYMLALRITSYHTWHETFVGR